MPPRRRAQLAATAMLVLVLGVAAASWVSFGIQPGLTDQQRAELAALEKSEANRRPKQAAANVPALCRALKADTLGRVSAPELTELSGLVRSRRTPNLFWSMQDSGGPASLVALRGDGSVAGSWSLPGAENRDWEDVATGPGPSGQPYLYAADIGDNNEEREHISIYRTPEPASPAGGGQTGAVERLQLRYPDGAHDAESLIVDPLRGTLLIITKGLSGRVYGLSKPQPWGGSATLKKYGSAALGFATAADVSGDGQIVALRGYFTLAIWRRRGNEPLTTTLRRQPCLSPTGFNDGQGEAIALSGNGQTAWSVAEGVNPPLRRYRPAAAQ